MSRGDRERLQDIKDAIEAVREHLADVPADPAEAGDSLVHDALLYRFVVIGEAVKHLAPETRERAEEIPWDDVAGLRDLIAHEYFRIEMGRILEIVERDLPGLERAIDRLLG